MLESNSIACFCIDVTHYESLKFMPLVTKLSIVKKDWQAEELEHTLFY